MAKNSKKPFWIVGLLCLLLLFVYFTYMRTSNTDKLEKNTETKGADVLGDSSVKHGSDNLDIKKTTTDSVSADIHK